MYGCLEESYEGVGDTEVIGWGSNLAVGIGVVPVLRKTTVVPVSNLVCSGALGDGRISEQMICAGAVGTDTCQVFILWVLLCRLVTLFLAGGQWGSHDQQGARRGAVQSSR